MSKIDVNMAVKYFVSNYLKQNQNAKETDVQIATRNYLQSLPKSAKVSRKDIAQVQSAVNEIFSESAQVAKANSPIVTLNPQTKKVLAKEDAKRAYNHYMEFNQMSKDARKRLHSRNMQDAKAAFTGDDYTNWLLENHPELYETPEKKISNNQAKKKVSTEYKSAKDLKQEKQASEMKSTEVHKRLRSTKPKRNAEYMTSQGQLTKEAKAYLEKVKEQLRKTEANALPLQQWIDSQMTPKASRKSAQKSINKNNRQSEEITKKTVKNSQKTAQNKAATTVKESTKNITKVTKDSAEAAAKKSHNKWLIAITTLGTAVVGILGYKTLNKPTEDSQNIRIQEAA